MLATIKQGDSGSAVKIAQYLTGNATRGNADGKFGPKTYNSVVSFQSSHGLIKDGIVGPDTWAALATSAPTCSTSKNKTSAATAALQIALNAGLSVDGIFGTKTKATVSTFQAANGLSVDGICGPKTWAALIANGSASVGSSLTNGTGAGQIATNGKVINNCVHYLQWDSKWKNVKYSTHTSSQTIGNSGCGPTAMAQIMATFIDSTITPVEMCALAVANGYRTYSNGTAWGFYEFVFKKYSGFSKFITTTSVETLKAALAQGALAVCSMNSNDNNFWTSGGHFVTAIGYDASNYIYANDPNKSECPRKQLASKFANCMKQAFIFWPAVKEETAPFESGDDSNSTAAPTPTRGDAIIDISKWQATVDYAKLIAATSLIILRAGYRGTGGSVKIDECIAKHAEGLRSRGASFGVYFYSIANTVEKAREEAQKFFEYAKDYEPLFWVMDAEDASITHDAIVAFADELRGLGAKRIGCYVANNHYKDYGYDSLRSLFDFTWIPRYGKNDGTIEGSAKPVYECDMWQYTSTGKISGISGNVDMNIVTGTGKTLAWFLGKE